MKNETVSVRTGGVTGRIHSFAEKHETAFLFAVFCLILLIYLPVVLLTEYPLRDVCMRYAPMADAFRRGDWLYAFHPRIQCLHPLVSGCIARLGGCSGYTAAKLSGLLFFALGVFPLYILLKNVFDRITARFGILIYAVASHVILISICGLRESHKMFACFLLTCGVLSVYRNRESYRGYLIAGAGCGLAFCVRNDLVCSALVLFFSVGAMEFAKLGSLKRTLAGWMPALILLCLEIQINYAVCGYATPGAKFHPYFIRIFGKFPSPALMYGGVILPGTLLLFAGCLFSGWLMRLRKGRIALLCTGILVCAGIAACVCRLMLESSPVEIFKFFKAFFRGLNPPLSIIGAVGLFVEIRSGKWDRARSLLLGCFWVFVLTVILQLVLTANDLYLSGRYLLPATPLLAGWSVIGIAGCVQFCRKHLPPAGSRILVAGCAAVLPALCLLHSHTDLIREHFDRVKKLQLASIKCFAEDIREIFPQEKYFAPGITVDNYRSNCRPVIGCLFSGKETAAAYLGGGSAGAGIHGVNDLLLAGTKYTPDTRIWEKYGKPRSFYRYDLQLWRKKSAGGASAAPAAAFSGKVHRKTAK